MVPIKKTLLTHLSFRNVATKKPTNGKLQPNTKFTRKNRLDENSHLDEWLRGLIPDTPPKGSNQAFSKKQWCQHTNMKAELDCNGENDQDGLKSTAKY